jgi:uncharacterized protein YegP (UPF0339 family)
VDGKYQINKATDGRFYFVLKAGNNEVILTSQLYTAKAGASTGIESVRTNSVLPERYQLLSNTEGRPYFNLTAVNGQVIGTSQQYSSTAARDAGVRSVQANGPTRAVEDLT